MDPSNYGRTAEVIGQLTDPQQLTQMLRNPQYAGFTNIIVARLTEINRMRQAPAATQQQPPSVADQAVQGMSRGGIVAFRHGGKVKKFAEGTEGHVVRGGKDISHLSYPYETPENQPSPWSGESYKDSLWASTIRPRITDSGFTSSSAAPIDAMAGGDVVPRGVYSPEGGGRPGDIPTAVGNFNPQEAAWLRAHGVKNPPVSEVPEEEPLQAYNYPTMGGGIGASIRSRGLASVPDTALADYYKQIQGLIGPDKGAEEDRAELAAQKKNALNNAMMYAGLGMARAGGETPTHGFFGHIATGATEGLISHDKQAAERQAQLRALNKGDRAEKMGIAGLAVNETAQDKRAAAAEAAAYRRTAVGAKPAEIEHQATIGRANEIRAEAIRQKRIDPSVKVPGPWEAYALARRSMNPGMYGAGLRDEASLRAQYLKEKMDPMRDPKAFFPSFESWSSPYAGGNAAPTTVRE